MKRVLLDQGLAPAVAAAMRADGWDAVHVCEVGLDRSDDAEIIRFAELNNRICVTLDQDFHSYLALHKSQGPSVVLIRTEGLAAAGQFELLQIVWSTCGDAFSRGVAVSANRTSVRIRQLPLG